LSNLWSTNHIPDGYSPMPICARSYSAIARLKLNLLVTSKRSRIVCERSKPCHRIANRSTQTCEYLTRLTWIQLPRPPHPPSPAHINPRSTHTQISTTHRAGAWYTGGGRRKPVLRNCNGAAGEQPAPRRSLGHARAPRHRYSQTSASVTRW
jgi:hypothetical protein